MTRWGPRELNVVFFAALHVYILFFFHSPNPSVVFSCSVLPQKVSLGLSMPGSVNFQAFLNADVVVVVVVVVVAAVVVVVVAVAVPVVVVVAVVAAAAAALVVLVAVVVMIIN